MDRAVFTPCTAQHLHRGGLEKRLSYVTRHPGRRERSVSEFIVRHIQPADAVHAFSCGGRDGADAISTYLREQALHDHAARLNTVWLVVRSGTATNTQEICGFFTLSPLSIPVSAQLISAIKLPATRYPGVGGYLLGRLGVAESFQHQKLGDTFVALALRIATLSSKQTGGAFVAVDAKNDALVRWYERLGFHRLDPARRRLIRPL